jgi:hypothetical protein
MTFSFEPTQENSYIICVPHSCSICDQQLRDFPTVIQNSYSNLRRTAASLMTMQAVDGSNYAKG